MKIAINGFGRIGRNIVRALLESTKHSDIELVAINDLGDVETNAMLFKYDSVHDRFDGEVTASDGVITINGNAVKVYAERNPADLPWGDLGIDVVMECTGFFANKEKASAHLTAGAKKVLISAPAGKDLPTIVYGVNDHTLTAADTVVSNASCTTNCLAPIVKPLNDALTIKEGLMTTIHAYTNDQKLTDGYHKDIRRARSATQSMIPTKTGAAAAVSLVLPELSGKLDGYAIRVPVVNVSVVDLTFTAEKEVSIDELNAILKKASEGKLKGILGYNTEPLVSIDFNHCALSSTFDATQTRKINNMYKVVSWYDNEWGFSNRMLDTATAMMNAS
ncbi:MAG: type I glyceraldehyde-3-phosphate dehydrogenase [Coxiella sp. (in: Bacteria)]|nr:MAG: type I glyceraldehyde-3-phosphate dehydrogenase [Coxiella sp. (in: g-proteobacteria)]